MSAFALSAASANVAAFAKQPRSIKARSARRAAVTTTAGVKVGDAAPDFTLMGPGFEQTTLSSLKGQKVVLAFFPAAFSGDEEGGCQCQLAALQSIAQEDGITVLGISKDTPFAMGKWSADIKIKCLADMKNEVAEQYVGTFDLGKFLDDLNISKGFAGYVTSNRGCVVLDAEGKVVYTWVGLDDKGNSHPGILPPTTEIQKALGIGKVNLA
eukprot:CAMPEP_0197609788 /NCGR_PEP_ID=MMETSP1326-20131121/51879_1 /TAXON_ID=1155430 /ORGANISM="Genus nov. species nov., Strain RCC2288" /LENGTH=211 /DNA_ID=CAMNT_0043178205 /DNA_START=56 /DNA_END=694 /DNA_ORIENTATION=+